MKRIILVILLIPIFIWSQTDTEIRLVNFSALKALDQYLYSCDIETFDKKDSFEELFTSDAVLFNDFVASNNFGSNISLERYIQNVWNTRNKRSSRNRKFFRPQINLKEIDFLYPDGENSGYVDLYVKKRLEFRLKSYKISTLPEHSFEDLSMFRYQPRYKKCLKTLSYTMAYTMKRFKDIEYRS